MGKPRTVNDEEGSLRAGSGCWRDGEKEGGGGGAGDALGMGGGGAAGGGDAAAPYLPTDAIATALRDLNAEINLIADKLDAALDAAATTMDDHGQYR